jgi:hypothetical protein
MISISLRLIGSVVGGRWKRRKGNFDVTSVPPAAMAFLYRSGFRTEIEHSRGATTTATTARKSEVHARERLRSVTSS